MANIFCTKKLEKLVGKKNMASEPADTVLGNWNANIFSFQRRKCLIVMNDKTYYSLIFLDILKADLLNFQELLYKRLIDQLDYDDIDLPLECSPKMLNELQPRFLPTNNNRKVLGTMNHFTQQIQYYIYYFYGGHLPLVDLPELNHKFTDIPVGAFGIKQSDYGWPIEEMQKILKTFCD